ncbi:PIN domain-containing protein [Candidatus Dependentiae bacterium]|nr:PIN domain-containing protein [Candidatus Dependentiae bacterium]
MNKIFLDSNILIYLYSTDEIEKNKKIKELLKKYDYILISTQVLFEFCHVMHRKLKVDYSEIEKALKEFYEAFEVILINYEMLLCALRIATKYKYSFPDSLIIAATLESDCNILFSEDMHSNHTIEGSLKIINPFL